MTDSARLPRHIEVELRFRTPEEGGRDSPCNSGYRPQMYYDGHDWVINIFFPDADQVWPGDTVRAYFCMMSPNDHVKHIHPDMEFKLREGARVIADGRITKVITLENSGEK